VMERLSPAMKLLGAFMWVALCSPMVKLRK
jgi:hypothetical protein